MGHPFLHRPYLELDAEQRPTVRMVHRLVEPSDSESKGGIGRRRVYIYKNRIEAYWKFDKPCGGDKDRKWLPFLLSEYAPNNEKVHGKREPYLFLKVPFQCSVSELRVAFDRIRRAINILPLLQSEDYQKLKNKVDEAKRRFGKIENWRNISFIIRYLQEEMRRTPGFPNTCVKVRDYLTQTQKSRMKKPHIKKRNRKITGDHLKLIKELLRKVVRDDKYASKESKKSKLRTEYDIEREGDESLPCISENQLYRLATRRR